MTENEKKELLEQLAVESFTAAPPKDAFNSVEEWAAYTKGFRAGLSEAYLMIRHLNEMGILF